MTNTNNSKNKQKWLKENKKLLRQNINKAIETSFKKGVLEDMLILLDKVEIRPK